MESPETFLPEADLEFPSPAMQRTLRECLMWAPKKVIVLLTGESGSGKDHLARYIHDHSPRKRKVFQSINCAAIAETLFESEFFGHKKGAFTGAVADKKGLLEQADGGTLFLNEVGELAPYLQAKLLSFLDTGSFSRVGEPKVKRTDMRIIAATNRDLSAAVTEKSFRRDLFYRLNVFSLKVPPLRERIEDVPVLANKILPPLCENLDMTVPEISTAAMRELQSFSWPGNVRELRNVLERAVVESDGKIIGSEVIERALSASTSLVSSCQADDVCEPFPSRTDLVSGAQVKSPVSSDQKPSVKLTDEQFNGMIKEVFQGNATPVTAIKEVLGWSRKTVSEKVKGLECPRGKSGRMSTAEKQRTTAKLREWLKKNGLA
jgi:DNA-binding NtrC family response regulator